MTGRTAAIVLAGGRSSRFGRDKLSEQIGAGSMLEAATGAVAALSTDTVVVTEPDSARLLPAGARRVADPRPFEGPLAGLAAGLGALGTETDRALVIGGDMPTLVPEVLGRLLEELGTHEAAVLADDDGPRPLPMAVRPEPARSATERLLARGERRLRALLAELDVAVVPPDDWRRDDPHAATLRDVDTPADLPAQMQTHDDPRRRDGGRRG
jgi:molybdopterin-guanine dinucleotide biosynthesis protein A